MNIRTEAANSEAKRRGWWPPKGLLGAAFWLGACFCVLMLAGLLQARVGAVLRLAQIVVGLVLLGMVLGLVGQLVRRRMLWSLRNKLVLTYLLIGLAPVVLFVTLAMISAYVAAGQFAIHLAETRLQTELTQMFDENAARSRNLARVMDSNADVLPPPPAGPPPGANAQNDAPRTRLVRESEAFLDGVPLDMAGLRKKVPFGLPPWAARLQGGEFHGMVLDGGELYLVVVHQHRLADGRTFSMVDSLPVDAAVMDMIADGLGRAEMLPARTSRPGEVQSGDEMQPMGPAAEAEKTLEKDERDALGAPANNAAPSRGRLGRRAGGRPVWIAGGNDPSGASLEDIRVRFLSTVAITDWDTGEQDNVPIEVTSRPSLLYQQLFGTSLHGDLTTFYRVALIVLCLVFLLIELLALVMAIRLSRTITASVHDLYEATQKIDRGELSHRIGVERNDQLAELSRSFNTMTGSLQRLLLEQQEKERLQNELSIAQEVQANLFPHEDCDLERLLLHGICRPARTVSGDYYDFLVFHEEAHDGQPGWRETGVGIALGDISGKGISAALLMATLHSAVRAYRFASEELVYSESQMAGLTAGRGGGSGGVEYDELFQSPGRILSLLNRHLYRSTQPEKYATLFLAHYDSASSMLTYSNAGHLPPLLLSQDGSVRRLDQGGTVVGLFDGMHYEEGRLRMLPGDILVAYSDGVTEPENDFGEFGEERMMDVVRRYRDQSLEVISSEVMHALDAWIGAEEQPDDITLVLARQL
jgi:sigma-B regulation protein RsbU (phosphoserine phosphatase)